LEFQQPRQQPRTSTNDLQNRPGFQNRGTQNIPGRGQVAPSLRFCSAQKNWSPTWVRILPKTMLSGPTTAVPQLLYLETIAAKWLFSQARATLHDICDGIRIVEPLSTQYKPKQINK
jgi:hypothetical protein